MNFIHIENNKINVYNKKIQMKKFHNNELKIIQIMYIENNENIFNNKILFLWINFSNINKKWKKEIIEILFNFKNELNNIDKKLKIEEENNNEINYLIIIENDFNKNKKYDHYFNESNF